MPVLKYWDGTQYVPILGGGGGLDQGTADARYVMKAGDTMTGPLAIQEAGRTLTLNSPTDYPEIVFEKMGAPTDLKHWHVYVSGGVTETGANASSLAFGALNDSWQQTAVVRMFRDGRMAIAADPTIPLEVATKQYVDRGGVDPAGSRRCLWRSTTTAISNNTYTNLTGGWEPTSGDSGNTGLLTYSGGIITLAEDAVLDMGLLVKWIGNATGRRYIGIKVNGSGWLSSIIWPTSANTFVMNTGMPGGFYSAGTTFQVEVYQDSGGTLNVDSNTRWNIRRVAAG